jgi:hypothetical protein
LQGASINHFGHFDGPSLGGLMLFGKNSQRKNSKRSKVQIIEYKLIQSMDSINHFKTKKKH